MPNLIRMLIIVRVIKTIILRKQEFENIDSSKNDHTNLPNMFQTVKLEF